MKKILEIRKKITNREGTILKTENGKEITIGSLLITVLDTSGDKGQNARRCFDLAGKIEKAMKEEQDEVCFEENNAIEFIKEKYEKYPGNAYTNVLMEDVFAKSEEEYKNRNNKKEKK